MAKRYKLTIKERQELRFKREIDLLVSLDLDLVHPRNDEEKAQIFFEALPWWDHPPSGGTLTKRRGTREYIERREQVVRNDDLLERMRYWAGGLMSGKDSVAEGYQEIIKGGPRAHKRLWLDAARDVTKMAGIRERDVSVGKAAIAFLEGLGIGTGQVLAQKKIELQREKDGTIVEGEVTVL